MTKTKRSKNYDSLKRFIDGKFKDLWQLHLHKWVGFNSHGVNDTYPNGKEISIIGFAYWGSPIQVFWNKNYIPAYMEEILDECLEKSKKNSKEYSSNPNHCLEELKGLFCPKIIATFNEMGKIDAILRNTVTNNGVNLDTPPQTEGWCSYFEERIEGYKLSKLDIVFWHLKMVTLYLKDPKFIILAIIMTIPALKIIIDFFR